MCFTDEPKPYIPSSPECMWQQQLPGAEFPALLGDWLNKKLHLCFPFSFPPSPWHMPKAADTNLENHKVGCAETCLCRDLPLLGLKCYFKHQW